MPGSICSLVAAVDVADAAHATSWPVDRLTYMTTSGHLRDMKTVRIAELKANLSKHLRAVQRGESLTVLDRDTPIAWIVPVDTAGQVLSARPAKGDLQDLEFPPPLPFKTDSLAALLEERRNDR
jgi:antitoxin (DNA-binding transcriptional repressor) of toxin-antitoxin stability system